MGKKHGRHGGNTGGLVPLKELPQRLRVAEGGRLKLDDATAGDVFGWDKDQAQVAIEQQLHKLEQLQYRLYADGRFGLLLVLQALDAGGKDGTIRHVCAAFNPQGCTVTPFKQPTPLELRHDFLWRVHPHVPARGEIGIFNRSHYEDVLVTRVDKLFPAKVIKRRYEFINDFERLLVASDINVVKVFLHISRDEEKRRVRERLKDPDKQWKYEPGDLKKRAQWPEYREAFEEAIHRCSTSHAPWYVVPANHKWARNLAVAQILVETLEALPLRFPPLKYDPKKVKID
jgi:PPK2 family polyphosphate:nucleotide phosphotransferase